MKVTLGRNLEQSVSEIYKTREATPKTKNKLRNHGKEWENIPSFNRIT